MRDLRLRLRRGRPEGTRPWRFAAALVAIIAAAVFAGAGAGRAVANDVWTHAGSDNLWSNAANWSAGVPNAADIAVFDDTSGGSDADATIDSTFAGNIAGIELTHYTGTLTDSNSSLNVGTHGVSISTGTFDISNQSVTMSGDWAHAGGTVTTGGSTVDFNGSGTQNLTSGGTSFNILTYSGTGTLKLQDDLAVGGNLNLNSGALDGNGHATSIGGNAVFDGSVSGLSSLHVTGTSAINTSSVTSTGSQAYDGAVTLAGSSTFTATSVTPGNNIESPAAYVFTAAAQLNLVSTSNFMEKLNGASAGSGYDQLAVSGNVILGNATLTVTVGFTPAPSETFFIVQSTGSVFGLFAGLSNGSTLTSGGYTFRISYDANDVTLTLLDSTSTAVSCVPASVAVGGTTNCTATVSDSTPGTATVPTGTVSFSSSTGSFNPSSCTLGAGTVSGGVASASCSSMYTASTAGPHTITATYGGDSAHGGSNGTTTVQAGSASATKTTMECDPSTVAVGGTTRCSATVTDLSSSPTTPTGTVTFTSSGAGTFANGTTCTLRRTGRRTAQCSVSFRPSAVGSGHQTITAGYAGDSTHSSSTGTTSIRVKRGGR